MKALKRRNAETGESRSTSVWSTKTLAWCSVLAALCVVLLYFGSLSVFDMTAVVICALITMLVVVEAGNRYAWLVVFAAGVLSLILLPVKLPALTYILIGGIYPILKARFERFRSLFAWLLKGSALGSMLMLLIVFSRLVFTAEETYLALSIPFILAGIAVLVVYDIALSVCITFYIVKLRKRLGLKKLF